MPFGAGSQTWPSGVRARCSVRADRPTCSRYDDKVGVHRLDVLTDVVSHRHIASASGEAPTALTTPENRSLVFSRWNIASRCAIAVGSPTVHRHRAGSTGHSRPRRPVHHGASCRTGTARRPRLVARSAHRQRCPRPRRGRWAFGGVGCLGDGVHHCQGRWGLLSRLSRCPHDRRTCELCGREPPVSARAAPALPGWDRRQHPQP